MSKVTVQIDVICETCHSSLEATLSNGCLYVEPCEACLTNEYDKGKKEVEES